MDRIVKYSSSLKNNDEHKRILNFLYTVCLGRIYSLEDNLESYLIKNVFSNLKDVKEKILDPVVICTGVFASIKNVEVH